jgi:hypothetical protein
MSKFSPVSQVEFHEVMINGVVVVDLFLHVTAIVVFPRGVNVIQG